MAITEERVRKFERYYKGKLFGMINEFSNEQAKLIANIQKTAKYANIDIELPNTGITLNNKIIELSHEFRNAGISMFSEKIEDYGSRGLDFVTPSLIGEAIINNMIEETNKATQVLLKYDSALQKTLEKRQSKSKELKKSGVIKRAFLALRGWIMPTKKIDFSYTEEETEELKSYLSEYSEIDQQLWKYNLRDNIVPSLVNHIKERGYSEQTIPGLIEECVRDNLQKLGLEDLIPELETELKKSIEKGEMLKEKSWELSSVEKTKVQQGQQQMAEIYMNSSNQTIAEMIDIDENSVEEIE